MIGDRWHGLCEKACQRHRQTRNSLIQGSIRGEAEKRGWLEHITAVTELHHTLEDAERALASYGIEADSDGELRFVCGETSQFCRTLQARADKELGTEDDVLKRCEIAKLKVLTATIAEEANGVVAALIES